MNNNFKIVAKNKTNFNLKFSRQSDTLKKITEFNAKISQTDFKNSYSRYSIELKLVTKAINECKDEDSKTLEILNARKKFLLDKLKTFGVYYE